MAKSILITGATGLIGEHLVEAFLKRGDNLIALSTNVESARQKLNNKVKIVSLNDYLSLKNEKIDIIINLAGASVGGKRWDEKYKQLIFSSRIDTARKMTELISVMSIKPEVFISISGIDYYGDSGDVIVDESSPNGNTFLAGVCRDWESSALAAVVSGTRVVILRTGFVIAKGSDAVKKLLTPFRFYVGGTIGSGRQYMSWVHIEDVVGIFLFAADNTALNGVVNLCSPNPETMKDFCKNIGKAMKRPAIFPAPSFAVKLIAGEMSEVILTGRRAIPKKIRDAGYRFKFDSALKAWKDVL